MTRTDDLQQMLQATLHVQLDWLFEHSDDVATLLEEKRDTPESLWIHRALNYIRAAQATLASDVLEDPPAPKHARNEGTPSIFDMLHQFVDFLAEDNDDVKVKVIPLGDPPAVVKAMVGSVFGDQFTVDENYVSSQLGKVMTWVEKQHGSERDRQVVELVEFIALQMQGIVDRRAAGQPQTNDEMLGAYLLDITDALVHEIEEHEEHVTEMPQGMADVMVRSNMEAVRDAGRQIQAIFA